MYISFFHMKVRHKKFDNDIMYICVQYYYLCYKLHSVFLHSSDYVKLFLQLKKKDQDWYIHRNMFKSNRVVIL